MTPTLIEQTVLRIFAEVMNMNVSIDHNFYDLGGESIEMTEIVYYINEQLGTTYTPHIFLSTNGTLKQIIHIIQNDLIVSST